MQLRKRDLSAAILLSLGCAAGYAALSRIRPRKVHKTIEIERWNAAANKIVILGGGFGGIATALALERTLKDRADTEVLLIERNNAQLFVPLLWTVAEGRANAQHTMVPIRSFQSGRSFHVLHAEITGIDLGAKHITTSAGGRSFDKLVIALGSVTTVPHAVPGAMEHAHTFRSPADAMQLRNRIIDALEKAHQCEDAAERAAWLTFVVIGGGDTGTELAAMIDSFIRRAIASEYPWLLDEPVRVIIVEALNRLVPLSSEDASHRIRTMLEKRGIVVKTGASVERIDAGTVYAGGAAIPTHTVFWSAGIAAPKIVHDLDAEHAKNGALLVDEELRVRGKRDVFAIGDNAWATDAPSGRPVPALAQAAEHEAKYVAGAISADLSGGELKPFSFKKLGQMTLLGEFNAVAEMGPYTFTGFAAWLMWHGYYASHVGSWRTRLMLISDWITALIAGRDTSELPLEASS